MALKEEIIDVLQTYIDAHSVAKPDIWKEREVTLAPDANLEPVVVCIWDSGVDSLVYPDQLYVNDKEQLDGKGNDGNGFVDDRHGIAYTMHEEKTSDMLFPMDDSLKQKLPEMKEFMKGLLDLQASIDSKEASALKKQLAQMKPEEAKPLFERLGLFGNFMHGTHVAGIAVADNPFARILNSRLTFDYHMIPEAPTVERAQKSVISNRETIDYFKACGVRVVNMSWGGDLKSDEAALEANGIGETPEERAKLAREIFDISKNGLYEAIKSAPEILFITSAGNSDNDVAFDEVIPSSFDLPNLMVVGAVDQAGEETSFSSFGENIDVHANGFEVESFLPGGDRMAVSGTSQASPQVTNLAAKLLAKNPSLTVAELIVLIKDGADKSTDGRCHLINPKKSMALLTEKMGK
ncbi:MAG: S8 family serine peptidase [Candidatus Zixiibacteriota bacterium]